MGSSDNEEQRKKQAVEKELETRRLGELVKDDGLFGMLYRAITGTSDLTRQLSIRLRVLEHQERQMQTLKADITNDENIYPKRTLKQATNFARAVKATTKELVGMESSTQNLKDALSGLMGLKTVSPDSKTALETKLSEYKKAHNNDTKYDEIYTKAVEYIDIKIQHQNSLEAFKQEINSFIKNYNNKHKNSKGDLHTHKKNVMAAIKTYLNEPTDANWAALSEAKNKNPRYSEGLFSTVRTTMSKVQSFHDQHQTITKETESNVAQIKTPGKR